jgi:hypothetical protein
MSLLEVLEMACQQHRIGNPNEYALILDDLIVSLDHTVTSLGEQVDLSLVPKSILHANTHLYSKFQPHLGVTVVCSLSQR